jgi:hypothetical protein
VNPSQLTALAVDGGIYLLLIAFVLYRQMTAQPLRVQRLVILPLVLGLFALQQLGVQHSNLSPSMAVFLVANLGVGGALGLWRGTTFNVFSKAGVTMTRGTWMTLLAWAALIVIRVAFALASHVTSYPQGILIGELLLALAVTFATQNVVLWYRSQRVTESLGTTG